MIIYIFYDPKSEIDLEGTCMESHEISTELHLLLPVTTINNLPFYHLENIEIIIPHLINVLEQGKKLLSISSDSISSPSKPLQSQVSSLSNKWKENNNKESNNVNNNNNIKSYSINSLLIMEYLSFWLSKKDLITHFKGNLDNNGNFITSKKKKSNNSSSNGPKDIGILYYFNNKKSRKLVP